MRLALLEERRDALPVVARVAAERLALGLAFESRFEVCLEAGVEGMLDPPKGTRRHRSKVLGQVPRLFREGIVGYYLVDESYPVGFFGVHGVAEHAHLHSPS